MLVSAGLALVGAVLAARAGTRFDAWYWMPVVYGAVMVGGLVWGGIRQGYSGEAVPPPPPSGDPTRDVTAWVDRWSSGYGLPPWQRVTGALATILTAVAGLIIAAATGEVFLEMPFSWWAIGMGILIVVGAVGLTKALPKRDG
ncbi:hypothetical protein BSZ37_12830 [Rubrivirga marina]|uniref:Uncharacterized protein n=2 Tax=Rubrivirga marina TaxID=1196024 RepID=A0A271J2I1_9BACT|nr:hypothetical protein BSZ37_12830 [Rubrivirga marina]